MPGEEEENAAELKIGEEFLKAKCLMNCEVAIILEHKYEQIQQHASESDPSSQVSQVFEKSLQYVKRFSGYKNPDAVRQVRETLSRYGLAEFELCPVSRLPCLRPEGILQKDETRQKLRHRPMDSAPHTEHFNTEAGKQKHQQHSIGCNPMP